MRKNLRLTMALLLAFICQGVFAQETHWTVDVHAFQYDMTTYVALTIDGEPVTDYSNYEMAAFCGDECRGVADIQTVSSGDQSATYGYLRIRSNQASGETITFKVFDKSSDKEFDVEETSLSFTSQGLEGMPSAPLVLNIVPQTFIPGDADGDGEVSVFDAIAIIDFYLYGITDGFNESAADFNEDGEVDIFDAVDIIDYYLNQ